MPLRSQFPDIKIPNVSVHDFIKKDMSSFNNDIALVDTTSKKKYTFAEVNLASNSIAAGLQQSGFRKGDIALVAVPNSADYAVFMLGVLQCGGIVSGVNTLYTTDEIYDRLLDCNPRIILTQSSYLPTIEAAVKMVPNAKAPMAIYVTDLKDVPGTMGRRSNYIPLKRLYEFCSNNPAFRFTAPSIVPEKDLAFLPYSSGTTGKPKGVMISHYNVVFALITAADGNLVKLPTSGQSALLVLPFFHVYGQSLLIHCLRKGCKAVIMQGFEPEPFLRNIQEHKIWGIYVVPPLVLFLAKDPHVRRYDLSSVQSAVCGAAPLGKEMMEEFKKRHPYITRVEQGYGMTECTFAVLTTAANIDIPFGSAGRLLNNWEAKIVDLSTGKELGPDQDGEFCMRSGGIMKGYWKRPDATAATIDSDGWLHSGDIGHYDNNGNFYIVDRLKELIKVKGFQVPPAELEDILLSHPDVREAAVIGIPDERHGETPKAFIVVKDATKHVDEDGINALSKERLRHTSS